MLLVIAANCQNSSESDKFLVRERNSECHKAVEVSEVRLVREVNDELDEVSEVDYVKFVCSERLMSDKKVKSELIVKRAK